MNKKLFERHIYEGLRRDREFMVVKIKSESDVNPRIVIVRGEDIEPTYNRYMEHTDNNMVFENTGDIIEDVMLTNNLNDISWFAY